MSENTAVAQPQAVTAEYVEAGVRSLLEKGYFVVERSISPEQGELAAKVLDELIARGEAQEFSGFGYAIHPLSTRDARMADFYAEPRVIAVLEGLFGDEAFLAHTGARVSEISHTPRISWHNHPYGPEPPVAGSRGGRPVRVVCAWYVEGLSAESGPLVVWPRHYDDVVDPPFTPGTEAWPGELQVLAPPGSCVIFTTELWHAAIAGTKESRRHLFGAHYQGKNNPRKHGEDHVHEGPAVEEAIARNPEFARILRR